LTDDPTLPTPHLAGQRDGGRLHVWQTGRSRHKKCPPFAARDSIVTTGVGAVLQSSLQLPSCPQYVCPRKDHWSDDRARHCMVRSSRLWQTKAFHHALSTGASLSPSAHHMTTNHGKKAQQPRVGRGCVH